MQLGAMVASAYVLLLRYNCEQGNNEKFAELRTTKLLLHLKINNFNCALQIYAADTRMEISL